MDNNNVCSFADDDNDPGVGKLSNESMLKRYAMAVDGGGYMCTLCGRVCAKKILLHLTDIHFHDGLKYRCPKCKKTYRTRNSFQTHISYKHKEWKKKNGGSLDRFVVRE